MVEEEFSSHRVVEQTLFLLINLAPVSQIPLLRKETRRIERKGKMMGKVYLEKQAEQLLEMYSVKNLKLIQQTRLLILIKSQVTQFLDKNPELKQPQIHLHHKIRFKSPQSLNNPQLQTQNQALKKMMGKYQIQRQSQLQVFLENPLHHLLAAQQPLMYLVKHQTPLLQPVKRIPNPQLRKSQNL